MGYSSQNRKHRSKAIMKQVNHPFSPQKSGKGILEAALLFSAAFFALTGLHAQEPEGDETGGGGKGKAEAAPSGAPQGSGMNLTVSVPVESVREKEDIERSNYTGLVQSPQIVRIVPRVSGELLEIGFKDGDRIRKDQMLYRLDDIKYQAAVKNAEAQVAQCKAKVSYAEKNYLRNKTLYERQAVSRDTLENAESTLYSERASQKAAEAELMSAQQDLSDCTISAPIDGLVAATNYTVGNYLTPSSGTLITLFQIHPIRVRFSISTRDFLTNFGTLKNLKEEAEISVLLSNGTKYPLNGKVELMNYEANQNTDTVQIYALFENPEGKLIPNSTVTVIMTKKNGLKRSCVPMTAVQHDAEGAYVWVLGEGKRAEKRRIVLGRASEEDQIVLSGLTPGDLIVTDGTHKVIEGITILPDIQTNGEQQAGNGNQPRKNQNSGTKK